MTEQSRLRRLPLWVRLLLNIVAAVVVVSLVQAFLVKVYRIPSGSMEQTLQGSAGGGDRVLVNRVGKLVGGSPEVGDIVVFSRPIGWSADGGPGNSENGFTSAVRLFGDMTGIGPSNEQYVVKRVVAREGQTIACCDSLGRLQLDGESVEEPYVYEDFPFASGPLDCTSMPRSARCFDPLIVPQGQLVVLGDHRSVSADSAIACRKPAAQTLSCIRTVPVGSVIGRVFVRIWPLDRIGAT